MNTTARAFAPNGVKLFVLKTTTCSTYTETIVTGETSAKVIAPIGKGRGIKHTARRATIGDVERIARIENRTNYGK